MGFIPPAMTKNCFCSKSSLNLVVMRLRSAMMTLLSADATLQTTLRLRRVLLLALSTLHTASSLFVSLGHLCSDTWRQHILPGPDGQDIPRRAWPSTLGVDKNIPAVYYAAIIGSVGTTPSSAT